MHLICIFSLTRVFFPLSFYHLIITLILFLINRFFSDYFFIRLNLYKVVFKIYLFLCILWLIWFLFDGKLVFDQCSKYIFKLFNLVLWYLLLFKLPTCPFRTYGLGDFQLQVKIIKNDKKFYCIIPAFIYPLYQIKFLPLTTQGFPLYTFFPCKPSKVKDFMISTTI